MNDYYIGDDMKLKEVLINILSNAIKFTDPGGSVTLSVERTAQFEEQMLSILLILKLSQMVILQNQVLNSVQLLTLTYRLMEFHFLIQHIDHNIM